ncbi:type VII secretion integral membrane protein EccD [Nocardioides sp.]|uniref:type VII secretion integral membrane protein EccD n=1 Tax=Nocardioides sp. TaxID=35761 RepID=UPI00352716D9
MSQGSTASSLLRVTVASGSRRVDLVLPGSVPLAELVPELARSVGLLDPSTVYAGYRVVTADGRELVEDGGLIIQGIEDGGLLTVSARVDDESPRVYDDVVEAMTDVVERDLRPWEPAAGRRTALGAAALLLALGAAALFLQGSVVAGAAAALVAVILVVGAVVLSRVYAEPEAAVALTWMAAGHAGVAGLVLATDDAVLGLPAAYAGGGALLVGLAALVGLGEGRTLAIPPAVVGAVLLAAGTAIGLADLDPQVVLATTLALVVAAGSLFPWLALGTTGTHVDQLYATADIVAEPDPIDPGRVAGDARLAHDLLVAVSATVGVLLVLLSPVVVSIGLSGVLLALICCAIVMLRTRQYRTRSAVLVGLVSGVAGLLTVAVAVLWLHPDWRPWTAVALAATGGVLLALTVVPMPASVRGGRLGDVAEMVALLALLPTLLVAAGVVAAVRG